VIAQFYQENKELKRKLVGRGFEEQIPQRKAGPMQEISKGNEVKKSLETTVVSKPTSPMIRSSTGNNSPNIQGKKTTSQRPLTSPRKGEKNIRWLNK